MNGPLDTLSDRMRTCLMTGVATLPMLLAVLSTVGSR